MTRLLNLAAGFAALANIGVCQTNSTRYCEDSTGICYSSFTNDAGISYRVALPDNFTTADVILEIVSPVVYNWAGIAWAGRMTGNPLTVAWPNGNEVVVSSRYAQEYGTLPGAYPNAEYTFLKGTEVNATHWTLNVRCQGCTRWSLFGSNFTVDGGNDTTLAFAYSSVAVNTPASNTSTFGMHQAQGTWDHDLTTARASSSVYDGWIENNTLPVSK